MRTNAPLLAIAAAALIGLSGCAAPSNEEPAAEASESSTETAPAPASEEDLTEDEASTTPPEACVSYEGMPPAPPAGAEGLVDAASAASLPDGVSLSLGVQVIASSDSVGSFEAVARICSEPLPEDEFRSAATSIAVAMKEDPASESLRVLKVTSWSPDAAGDLQQGATLTADYPTYTWDPETSGVPLDANWDWS